MRFDIVSTRRSLLDGKITSSQLIEQLLATIAAESDEASKIFIAIDSAAARKSAADADRLYNEGKADGYPLLGIPLSVKDLFDMLGQVSTAGTKALRTKTPAKTDAIAIGRLRAAGAIIVGRTAMSELAFSGVGINPHYGTPSNPCSPDTARITGGSSSGAAASVARGMVLAGIGSDTGGSVRIPAALCGLVGYKPTQQLIPRDGTVPLSHTLDSVGPIGLSVADCALLADVMAAQGIEPPEPADLSRIRFLAPTNYVRDGASPLVLRAFERSLESLRAAGATVDETEIPEFSDIPSIMKEATFPAYEGYRHHSQLVAAARDELDPLVLARLEAGRTMSDTAYMALVNARKLFIDKAAARLDGYDALLMPTVPVTAPKISDLEDADAFNAANLLLLRNPTTINLLDGCAVSVPNTLPNSLPTGLSVAGTAGQDRRILAIAAAIELLTRKMDQAPAS